MEFRLNPDQVDLQEAVARFFGDRFPLAGVAAREGVAIDRRVWSELAELGVFGLLVDETDGGSGLGVLEAALVFEQVGLHLVPGPLLWSVVSAPLIAGVVTGACVVAGVEEVDLADGSLVEHAMDADLVVVLHDHRVVAHPVAALDRGQALNSLDPLTGVGRVSGFGAGTVVGDEVAAGRMRLVGTVLAAATLVGVAGRSLETARAYALERQQFDAPIGSFQAVKHLLADMYLQVMLAQSATYAAAAVVDHPGADDPGRVAAAAKLVAANAARAGAATAIQILGGMGFTWDMLPNYLLKRAWHLEHAFGASAHHAECLGRALVGGRT